MKYVRVVEGEEVEKGGRVVEDEGRWRGEVENDVSVGGGGTDVEGGEEVENGVFGGEGGVEGKVGRAEVTRRGKDRLDLCP